MAVAKASRNQMMLAIALLRFSPEAARSYADMTGTVVDEDIETPAGTIRGTLKLMDTWKTSL
ncbi:hypothetical protein [Falsirhodobacter xinxiangensis]|uniref:hypothetical protein n=1 Tax=Falsirhodobacter xinxiangensis TaxID=2530049 RepID=UPI0010AA4A8F|nr:hypothetical protein [Rhodobacter xinxiangensis]